MEGIPKKRTFDVIRELILVSLLPGRKTINQIANETNINWRTVELHLTFLMGLGLIKEVFSSEYVRIFELTENGKQLANSSKEKFTSMFVTKLNGNSKEVKFSVNL